MNRKNIQDTINILQRARNFDIRRFQRSRFGEVCVNTEEELHACGNSACIAGYVAVSPEWAEFGGKVEGGYPYLTDCQNAAGSLATYWDLPKRVVSAIVYGSRSEDGQNYAEVLAEFGVKDLPLHWGFITKEDAIGIFQQLLANETDTSCT
jgi:hypothetical protein